MSNKKSIYGRDTHGRDGSPSRPQSRPKGGRPRGVSLPERKWLYHGVPPWVSNPIYFVTINCRARGGNELCREDVFTVIQKAVSFYHGKRWWVHLWLIMPDHNHGLLSFPESESIVKVVGDWKRYTARHMGVAWQKGFFDHRLRGDESLEEKGHYIRMNPVRAELVTSAEEWPLVFTAEDIENGVADGGW